MMIEKELLKELREIQKNDEDWKNSIPLVAEKLNAKYPINVRTKALWILGEMGLRYPQDVKPYIEEIVDFLEDKHPKLRERAVNALGRIGRADKNLVIPYLNIIMEKRFDDDGNVRLSFVWACENIATNAPELFCKNLDIFYDMIDDSYEKVRIEAPEMFRVVGKRNPECVKPYLDRLQFLADNDEHRIVRIHCAGAVRLTKNALKNE